MEPKTTPILKLDMKADHAFIEWIDTGREKAISDSTKLNYINKFWIFVKSTGKLPFRNNIGSRRGRKNKY